ncbi:hypothetical protein GGP41_005310 [Bipolaris sorokiniana]|uniref:C2H2-type domain-containing protein n=1 Tax=Cochliobolus sativus TaxID=45130 RepID=A0A8H5ZJC3_COCSA|nr:hypothetical protein GGP41_005310 [Bipolaris sorokiniana]
MSAPHDQNRHPRRRPLKGGASPLSTHAMQLRKSGTFSSPTHISSDICDLDRHFLPRRSPTNTERLEQLVQESIQDPSVRRVTNLLNDIEAKIAGQKGSPTSSNILSDPEVFPVPSLFLDNTVLDHTPMDIDSKPSAHDHSPHDHASDSGLGSSVSGSRYDDIRSRRSSVRESISTSISSTHSAVTRSFSALGASDEGHTLGEYACKQIHDSIVKPILAEESLKDFHELIKDVPRRIGEKNIRNLRDLEKTLIFLAPELSATPDKYSRFCERSIQLLATTVQYLSEQDQRLPTDRPYTDGYFLDLMEQIRRYASIMAATREKESKGEDLDDMDYSRYDRAAAFLFSRTDKAFHSDEKITLRGGLSHNGRPVELTHSRPWKCSEKNCKYFDLGWPTEKERDRHMNDKHSAAPAQYKCLYPPCTYASKRESNCKQHMEKAHGWEYVRSKSNGRKKAPSSNNRSPATPLTPFIGTPMSAAMATPVTPFIPSPQVPMMDFGFGTPAMSANGYQGDFRRDSIATDGSHFTYSSGHSPVEPTSFNDAVVTPEDVGVNHNDVYNMCNLDTNINTGFQQPTPMSTTFDFEPLQFTSNNQMNNGYPQLSPMAQPDVTLFSPHMDEGFGDMDMNQCFNLPGEDFTLFDASPPSTMAFNNTTNFFPEFNQVGGQFDDFCPEPTTTLDDLNYMNFMSTQ